MAGVRTLRFRIGNAMLASPGLGHGHCSTRFGARLFGFDEYPIAQAALPPTHLVGSMGQLIERSEIVILALPLSARTFTVVGADALRHAARNAPRSILAAARLSMRRRWRNLSRRKSHWRLRRRCLRDGRLGDREPATADSERLLALRDRTLFTPHLALCSATPHVSLSTAAAAATPWTVDNRQTPSTAATSVDQSKVRN